MATLVTKKSLLVSGFFRFSDIFGFDLFLTHKLKLCSLWYLVGGKSLLVRFLDWHECLPMLVGNPDSVVGGKTINQWPPWSPKSLLISPFFGLSSIFGFDLFPSHKLKLFGKTIDQWPPWSPKSLLISPFFGLSGPRKWGHRFSRLLHTWR